MPEALASCIVSPVPIKCVDMYRASRSAMDAHRLVYSPTYCYWQHNIKIRVILSIPCPGITTIDASSSTDSLKAAGGAMVTDSITSEHHYQMA